MNGHMVGPLSVRVYCAQVQVIHTHFSQMLHS